MKSIQLALAAALFALPVHAQSTRYDVKTINFDLWCQEQAKLPPDRCDKRLPGDETLFEAYRAKIEKYEVPYLKQREKEQQFDTNVLHNDPVDNPVERSPPPTTNTPTPSGDQPGN